MLSLCFPDAKRPRRDSEKEPTSMPGSPVEDIEVSSPDGRRSPAPERMHSPEASVSGTPTSPKESNGAGRVSPAGSDSARSSCASAASQSPGRALIDMASEGAAAAARRAPIDMLARVFPHMRRSVLQLILQGCSGDVVQAIEQVLNNHNESKSSSTTPTSSTSMESSPMGIVSHRPYMTTLPQTINGVSTGIKSAFSPISSLAASSQVNPMRYAYASNAGRLALAMPYPPGFMPNLATLGYPGYSAAALSSVQKSAGLTPYGICPCPYGTSPTDKWQHFPEIWCNSPIMWRHFLWCDVTSGLV